MHINTFLSKVICVWEIKTGNTYVVIAVQTIATVDPPVQTSGGFSPSSPAARILIQSLVKSLLTPLPSIWCSTFPSSPTMLLFYLHCSPCWSFKSSRLWFRQNTPISSGGKTQTLADIFSRLLREKWSCIWMETCFSLNNCSYTLCIRNESDLMLNHSIYSTPISCMFTLKLTESFKLKSEFIITQYWFIILQKRQRSKLSTENWHCWVTDFDRPPAYCRSRTLSHYSFSFT